MGQRLANAGFCLKVGELTEAYRWASKATKLDASDSAAFVVLGEVCAKLRKSEIAASERTLIEVQSASNQIKC